MTDMGRTQPHKVTHESGGTDELDLSGLTPGAHAAEHESGGGDEVAASGLVGRINFVPRGDVAAADWTQATLTTDGNWYDLDLSSIVPAGTVAIALLVNVEDNLVNQAILIRQKGFSNFSNLHKTNTQVAGIPFMQNIIVGIDATLGLSYKTSNTTFSDIQLTIKGWFV